MMTKPPTRQAGPDHIPGKTMALMQNVVAREYFAPRQSTILDVVDLVRIAFANENRVRSRQGRPELGIPTRNAVRKQIEQLATCAARAKGPGRTTAAWSHPDRKRLPDTHSS
ncbi:hypothetical protein D1114_20750 [Cereibacter sphaeroides]|uniref:Uncharacterized protein n=1 Tax=Cereibacter sphaeroides TaxID=1063 RepID=A0AAX1UFQ1_CERSP|nr:hypothetical protein [Cereibacter sphaeroides]RDS93388.1 hypothetical protein DWF04_23200 [Cereibacter sphaeroides f. sp. denitrificans]RHZ91190.1 hypothetical protein D1114_20750 [Cereibacter sphaeroides]